MESFIAAHLGEGGGGDERGRKGIQRQQIHSSILAPPHPPIHNNLRISSIALLSFIINTESHPTDSMHTHTHTHTHKLPLHNHPALLFIFFPGQTHCMCLMGQYMWCVMWLTAPLPCCPAFKPSSSSGCLSPGVDYIFYLSCSLPWLYFSPAPNKKKKKKKKKILGRKLQSA